MTSTRPPFPIAGHWPALLTPVDSAGRIDQPRLLAQARRMLAAGASGVTLFGTSGEGPAFAVAARQAALDALLAAGIAPSRLIVTLTASALPDAIALGRDAVARQCAGTLLMPPYYFNRPRDAGVVAAVSAVVDALDPVGCANLLLYQFPSLSNVSFSHAAIAELSRRHPEQIVGIKDSTGDLAHSLRLIRAFPALAVLVGAETDVAPAMCAGGAGSINGLANIAPGLMQRIVAAPDQVSPEDEALVRELLGMLTVLPDLPFVPAYKVGLAEQTGDDAWLAVCPPLAPLTPDEEAAVRGVYRRAAAEPDRL